MLFLSPATELIPIMVPDFLSNSFANNPSKIDGPKKFVLNIIDRNDGFL